MTMSDHAQVDGNTRIGTIGGTLLVTLLNIFQNDLIRTTGFAALGASVSFFVSLFWKWVVKKWSLRKRGVLPKNTNDSDKA